MARIWLAFQLDLYADEAFYYQCSLRPALAYADLPPLTALTVKAGVALWGANPFGVRFFFLLTALTTPLAIYHLAKSQTPNHLALAAAGFAFVIPGFGFISILAIPDVLLGLETILFLFFFERATRTQALGAWVGLGLVAGMGLVTHYRFATSLVACLIYLFLTKQGRHHLKMRGIWLAGLIALPGLLPAGLYNLQHQGAPLRYFLFTRHDPDWKPEAWLQHLVEQMAAISPLLWFFALVTLGGLVRKALHGDDRAKLFSIFALVPLGLFFMAAPLQTTGAQSVHWSLPGFIPLLIFLPATLDEFAQRISRFPWRRWLVGVTIGLAVAMLGLVYFVLGTGRLDLGGIREPFAGWQEATAATQAQLEKLTSDEVPIAGVVADNYKLGAQLELALGPDLPLFILDHSKNYEHGRQLQFDRWGIGETALRTLAGEVVLVAVQWSELAGSETAWQQHLDWFFRPLEPIGQFHFPDGHHAKRDKRITFYLATVIKKR